MVSWTEVPESHLSVDDFEHFGQQLMSFSNSSMSCSMRFTLQYGYHIII